MFVTMNRISVADEHRDAFEERFRSRQTHLDTVPGFVRNMVMRPVDDTADRYIVFTLWKDRESFEAWTKSDAFKRAHSGASSLPEGTFLAPAKLEMFEAFTDLQV